LFSLFRDSATKPHDTPPVRYWRVDTQDHKTPDCTRMEMPFLCQVSRPNRHQLRPPTTRMQAGTLPPCCCKLGSAPHHPPAPRILYLRISLQRLRKRITTSLQLQVKFAGRRAGETSHAGSGPANNLRRWGRTGKHAQPRPLHPRQDNRTDESGCSTPRPSRARLSVPTEPP